MPLQLVETKFFVPHAREGAVARPRLDDRLGPGSRLTLVSAPAGFGKTTLMGSWLAALASSSTTRVAWVSLDAGDREATRFWTYVLTALDRAAPGAGSAGLAGLDAGQPVEVVLAAVLNELSVLPDDLVLVLDDYHLADGPTIQAGMALLLDRLPPQVRLVIGTRADPHLPLARLRARGELSEVRAADLRFTDPEISAFLATTTGLSLDARDLELLGHRTEGWVASLQLAALSLRSAGDPSAFIAGFAGDDRYVVDYLVEEVLGRESAEVRDFLLRTAVLDRLTGPLCDAVTGGTGGTGGTTGGAEMLESLERRNLFVVPLDDQRRWYRYHHLFADVLRARLLQQDPGVVAELHRRAGDWWAEQGAAEEAVRHTLAAGDQARAADLAEAAIPDLQRARREALLRRWATQFPDDVVHSRPVLAVGLVGGLMASNDLADIPRRLDDVEGVLAGPASELHALDAHEVDRLPGAIATYRAALSLVAGDLSGAVGHATDAMAKALEDDPLTRAAGAGLAGLAHWTNGDIEAARRSYLVCVDGLVRADHLADVLGCSLALSDMELALGRLRGAEQTLRSALDMADRREHGSLPGQAGPGPLRGSADMLVALSRCAWHRNDLDEAADLLRRADVLGEAVGLPQHPYRWRVALARLRTADRDYSGALDLLDEAERVYVGDFSPQVHPVHATRARVLLAAGDLDAALDWSRRHDLGADDALSYLREYEHLTLARLLLAQHRAGGGSELLTQATALLTRLGAAAEAGGRLGTVLEIEVLRAGACVTAGDDAAALTALERALDLAEPDGWVRWFVDAGPAVSPVLEAVAVRRPGSAFVHRLRAATGTGVPQAATAHVAAPALPEPLSDRELEVLRLLATDLDGPMIARELVVSLNTVRTHTKHIYTKLDVNNRRSAVTRGHQLGLLRPTARA